MQDLLLIKPVLIGLHLGLGIVGIDAFLWLAGEYAASAVNVSRKVWAASIGTLAFASSWVAGGYYYVTVYGTEVKPLIKAGAAPWAHAIFMESKEHIFLFIVPMAFCALMVARVKSEKFKGPALLLSITIAGIGLLIGLMGFIISAAARWGQA